tara:strand:- start:41 stop:220 length:180 start_codon:yes stop_codon:yes gene_type:complete
MSVESKPLLGLRIKGRLFLIEEEKRLIAPTTFRQVSRRAPYNSDSIYSRITEAVNIMAI